MQKRLREKRTTKCKKTASKRARVGAGGRARQLAFFREPPRSFGGALLKSHPKVARTLSTKESIHLVLKSEQAVGARSMLRKSNAGKIDHLVRAHAKANDMTIYQLVNVGNHLHLVVRLRNHKLFARFIRGITGVIARHVLKRERGASQKADRSKLKVVASPNRPDVNSGRAKPFWVARPFTRLIAWGRDYNYVKSYMDKNRNQAGGQFVAWGFDVVDATKIRFLNTG